MAKKTTAKTYTTDDAAADLVSAFEKFVQTLAGSNAGSKAVAEPVEDVDDDAEEVEVEVTREQVEEATASGIKALRALAAEVGIEETKKADILAAFEEILEDEEDEDEDEDDEEESDEDEADEDDEDEEDEEEEFDRDELEGMTLAALKKLAKSDEGGGHSAADIKGLDKDDLIDLIMGEDEEDEEDEDDDEEEEELDEDALLAMSHKELLDLSKELDIKVPAALKKSTPKSNHKKLVALILDSGEDE